MIRTHLDRTYTLAAVLGYAAKFGDHIQNDLAFIADEILTNGDFDNLNADVIPSDAPRLVGRRREPR